MHCALSLTLIFGCVFMKITLYPKYFLRSLSAKGKEDFFSAGYRFLYPECSRQGMTPWQHYVMDGKRKGYGDGNHPPADVFFAEGYEAEYPDVTGSGMDPWRHYAEKGQAEGRDNGLHPDDSLFFADGYLAMYPDVAEAGIDPWHHYVMSGRKEGRDNGFNPDWTQFFAEGYLAMYPDVAEAGIDPWHHYVLSGRKEGRSSGLHPGVHAFSAVDYLAMYPDVAESGQEPWHHYVLCGKEEGRYPTAIAMKRGKSRFMPYSCALLTPDIGAEFSDSLGRFDLHTLVEILKLKSGKKGGSGAARGADSYRSQKLFRLFGNDDAKKIVYFCSDESLAEKQCRDEVVQQFIDRQYVVLAISWDSSSSGFILHCHYGQNSGRFDSADLSLLLRLGLTNTAKIFLGSLDLCPGNADELDSAADLIISLKKQTKAMLVYSGQVFPGNSGSGQDSQTASDSGNERNRTVYAKLLNSCDGYMFVSGEAFSNAAKICSLDPEKIIQDCLPAAKAPVGQWAYSRDRAFARFTVLVCGTAEGERGYEYVKDLAGRLAETHPDVRIVVLGESQESEAPENVNVTGAYDSSRMPELMRIFEPNCAVVPFVSAETLSAVQEMTAFGVPVVTFDTGSSILSAYRQKVQVPNISADGLHKAVSELYDLSYPYKLKKHARRYSVSSEELRFINQHEGRTGRKGVRTTLSICINVADENEDYESILDYLNSLPAAADAPASPKRGRRLLESDDISICFLVNEKFIDEFRQSEKIRLFRDGRYKIIPTNGCGAFKLLREPESYGKVIYIGAFSKFVSSIEKYYILTSLFGKSGEQIGEISSLLNRQDVLLYLDNFYKTTSRNVAAKRHQNEAYLQARRAYLTHGSFEQYLDHSDSGICAFRNAFAFNISLLKKVSGLILDKRFFVSCPDQVVFDLALNDLTVRAAYKYIELIPGSVAERHLSSQRELFHEMALANFNLDFYLEKYSEMKDRNVRDPFAHFRDHGFDENRLYADFISDEWLESHYDSA